jgi:hypothetical protein
MTVHHDLLIEAVCELRQALDENTGRPLREWIDGVDRSVADALRALRRHAGEDLTGEEFLADPDRALLPSPGVERRAAGLRQDLHDLIQEARTLRADLAAARSTPNDPSVAGLATRARDLMRALERLDAGEINLIQDAITPDIGAGD